MRHHRSSILHTELQNHGDFNLLWQNKKLDKLVFRLLFSYLNFLEMRRKNPTRKFVWLTLAYDNLLLFLVIIPKNKSQTYSTSNFGILTNMSGGRIWISFSRNHPHERWKHKLSRLFSNPQASTVFFCACQLNYLCD